MDQIKSSVTDCDVMVGAILVGPFNSLYAMAWNLSCHALIHDFHLDLKHALIVLHCVNYTLITV